MRPGPEGRDRGRGCPEERHAPPPGTGFLYRGVLAATAATSAALTLVVLPAYLILAHSGLTAGQARAGADLAWASTR